MKRIVLEGLLAALCVGMCGCVDDGVVFCKTRSYPYWTDWTDGELITIANDSLAVVATHKYKKECIYEENYGTEATVDSRAGLFLVNYRVKQKPLIGDTLELPHDLEIKISKGSLIDSSALLFDFLNKKFAFWKIGEKSIKFSSYNDIGSPIDLKDIRGVSPWVNKELVIKNYGSSSLYLLDTEKGQIKRLDPEEYEWIFSNEEKKCALTADFCLI